MSMKVRHIILVIAAILLPFNAHCQRLHMDLSLQEWKTNAALRTDTASLAFKPYSFIQSSILPIGMLTVSALQNDYLLDRNIHKAGHIRSPLFPAADWIQYSPAAIMLAVKACGIDGRNDWTRMLTADIISTAAMVVLVNGSKYSIARMRPDGSSRNSYPSGHTATSFMTATMLHLEYGQTVSPWFSVLGYSSATAVGLSRIIQDRHWISDVMAGASIGIFSTYLGYGLTDFLFADRRLIRPVSVTQPEELAVWQFSIDTDYSLAPQIKAPAQVCHPDIAPAYSVGANADWMCLRYVGLSLASKLTQLQWRNSNPLIRPENAYFSDLFTLGGGLVTNIPIVSGISVMGRLDAGHTFGHNYHMQLSDSTGTPVSWSLPSGLRMWGQVGISFRATGNTALTAFAGKDYYKTVWNSWTVGTSFNLLF